MRDGEPQEPEEECLQVCVVVQVADREGFVLMKHSIYQDAWCWRAVNHSRSQEEHKRQREGGKARFSMVITLPPLKVHGPVLRAKKMSAG